MKSILLFKTLQAHYILDYFYIFKIIFKMLQQNRNIKDFVEEIEYLKEEIKDLQKIFHKRIEND